ncbi:MAG: chemotaxis protein CheW, partial [Pirellulaceae bacterium]|nr:chemotaxis protein CheW [Pirellulaceae bacterium]
GEQRFAIPQINIAELVRVRTNELSDRIGNIKGAEVLRLRGALLPLVAANTALDLSSVDATGHARTEVEPTDDTDDEARHVIVVETGQTRYGLVVDELHDSEEIVVKPLGRHLTECNCLAGATVLGDGRVALILDVAGIAAATDLRISDHDEHNDDETADVHRASVLQGEIQSVLLFNNAPEELFAIPMSLVARIERIAAAQIDAVGGSEVLQYRGATLPVMRLEQRVDALPCPEKDTLFVIVFNVAGREWGLIASDLVDIRELEMEVDTHTLSGRGVLGSMVVDGQVTRFLDLHDIVDLSDGESNARASNDGERSSTAFANGAHRVMLAEDSDFFRHQVRRFLEEKSIDVVDYENGRLAWEALKAGEEVDLIITDVEMPEMNGFEFCERVKSDPHLRSIPVITLTSLAGENDEKRGRQAGADDYQTKMDRERLLASVDALIDKRRLGLTAAAH